MDVKYLFIYYSFFLGGVFCELDKFREVIKKTRHTVLWCLHKTRNGKSSIFLLCEKSGPDVKTSAETSGPPARV